MKKYFSKRLLIALLSVLLFVGVLQVRAYIYNPTGSGGGGTAFTGTISSGEIAYGGGPDVIAGNNLFTYCSVCSEGQIAISALTIYAKRAQAGQPLSEWFGEQSGSNAETGNGPGQTGANEGFGGFTGHEMTTGFFDTLMGREAGSKMQSAFQNSCFGHFSCRTTVTGSNITAVGDLSAVGLLAAVRDTCIGALSCASSITAADSTFLGYASDGTTTSTVGGIAIGSNAKTISHALVIGGSQVSNGHITQAIFGSGITDTTPFGDFDIKVTSALTGSNGSGSNLRLNPGRGDGTGHDGYITANGRFELIYGNGTAAANNLTLADSGNAFVITGNTTINAITSARWNAGSQIVLQFTGTPLVKNNTAGGGGTSPILLSNGSDTSITAGSLLGLQYDGTNWNQTFFNDPNSNIVSVNYGTTTNLTLNSRDVEVGAGGTGATTVNLPTSPSIGWNETVCDFGANATLNNITVDAGTGKNIIGATVAQTYTGLAVNGACGTFKYVTANNWKVQ